MIRILLALCLIFPFLGRGQVNLDFNRLTCEGLIPNDFTQLSTHQYEQDYSVNEDENLDADFFISTRFYTDQLLQSGTVLFNTPHSNYITEIARYLLKDNLSLFNDLRFYVVRSNVVNAYSTDQGLIIFTTGILAHVKNEAQLSFIVAHEISHYLEKHVRKGYIEYKDFNRSSGDYHRTSYLDNLNRLSLFNKEQELEADAKGIGLYLTSDYDPAEIENAFRMLQFGNLPFEDEPFDINFLATKNLIIPKGLIPELVTERDTNFNYNDDFSTHPNIQKRIDAAHLLLGENVKKEHELFHILSRPQFIALQDLVRFESVNIDLAERYYADALYSIFLLSKEYPNNRFLDCSKIKALYGLAKYKNNFRFDEVTTKLKIVEGESYKLHYFLRNLTKEQLNIVTYRHLADMVQKYPEDQEFLDYFEDFETEFALNSNVSLSDLKSVSLNEVFVDTLNTLLFNLDDSIRKIDLLELPKLERAKLKKLLYDQNKQQEAIDPLKDYHLYALHDLAKNGDFISNLELKRQKLVKEKIVADSLRELELDKVKNQGYHLGLNSIMVIDPAYENYKLNGKNNYTKSEARKIQISETYLQEFPNLELDIKIVDSKSLKDTDVEIYNDLSLIKTWMTEIIEHDGISMISSTHLGVAELARKYGVNSFLFSGIIAYKERNGITLGNILLLGTYILAPVGLVDIFMVHNNFRSESYVFGLDNDALIMVDEQDVNLNPTPKIVRSYIYNLLYQINSTE